MQINSVSSSVPMTFSKPASSPAEAAAAGDQITMSTTPDAFSSYVSAVGQMPEVRNEMVGAYKARVQAGYPAPSDLENLVHLMGATWSQGPASDGSFQ